jgi:hypothetical protein
MSFILFLSEWHHSAPSQPLKRTLKSAVAAVGEVLGLDLDVVDDESFKKKQREIPEAPAAEPPDSKGEVSVSVSLIELH